jgi:hypothetical protein
MPAELGTAGVAVELEAAAFVAVELEVGVAVELVAACDPVELEQAARAANPTPAMAATTNIR